MFFKDKQAWQVWLEAQHVSSPGVWLRDCEIYPNAIFDAIRLLETGSPTSPSGDILETAPR